MNVLLEEVRSQYKGIKEGQEAIEIRLAKKIDTLSEKVLIIEKAVMATNNKLDSIETQLPPMQFILREHDQRLKVLEKAQ